MPEHDASAVGNDTPDAGQVPYLVGIGASAGGIPALRAFFRDVPARSGVAFVVIMHLSPEHESHLAEVLEPGVRLPVHQVQGRTRLAPDTIYVIPPGHAISVTDGHLELSDFEGPRGRRTPVDIFFRTLAEAYPDSIGVILSGSGTDGVVGLKAIKEAGGVILAQAPEEAEYDGMPGSAIATGLVDLVLPARELGARVVALSAARAPWATHAGAPLDDDQSGDLATILQQLRTHTGHDFQGYKSSTILRRIARRMQVTQTASLASYFTVLQGSAAEADALLKDLLISVTHFFRDPAAFAALATEVVPVLFAHLSDPRRIRVWVPGSATGEEAYGVAVLLAEHMDDLNVRPEVQIFATDLDHDAIERGREGLYPAAIATDVGPARLARFFRREGDHYRVSGELRDMLLFTHHDALRDPPFSRLDLVCCRNLLIYMERPLQERLLGIFHYALRAEGFLFLGNSETVDQRAGFEPVDRKHRIYRRLRVPRRRGSRHPELPPALPATPATPPRRQAQPAAGRTAAPPREEAERELHRQGLEAHAPPSVLVTRDHTIVHVSESANRYLEFPAGTPSANLVKVVLPELRLELGIALHQALEKEAAGCTSWVRSSVGGQDRRVQMYVTPTHRDDAPMALVVFLETAVPGGGTHESGGAADRLQDAEAALGITRQRVQDLVESSETRQEELRAANEELQSINEEYRSTVEELETSKEELQSMNEELKTLNAELNEKVTALARANDDIHNLMASTEIATLFLDRELRIRRYTPALAAIFNVLPTDEDRPLHHLTHRLDYPELAADCRSVLSTLQPLEREAEQPDGRAYLVRITPYRSDEDRIGGVVATFTEVTRLRQVQRSAQASAERFQALVYATAEIVWTTDPDGRVVEDSPSWHAFTGQSPEARRGSGWLQAVHPEDRTRVEEAWQQSIDAGEPLDTEFRLRHDATGQWRVCTVRAVPVLEPDATVREWVGMCTDITERRATEEALRHAKVGAERAAEVKSQFLATMSHELRTPLTAIIGLAELLETEVTGPTTHDQKLHLKRIRTSAWHLVSIIEEVLTFSRSEAGQVRINRATVDVTAEARSVVEVLEAAAADKGLVLELQDADRPEYAFTDGGKARQIITNLIGNAVKFTDAGGVSVRVEGSASEVVLSVRDTGPGIPPDMLDTIFEPFVQLDASSTREKGGVGLGLAVSRRLARLMGGHVDVTSEPGAGSTFTLRLPRAPDQEMTRS
ncbi:MAG: chemotaxis protein CheB [Gemmatimonadota bacterium]